MGGARARGVAGRRQRNLDIDLGQIEHALQTAEAIRRDGHPRWFVVSGLVHDLGKVLCTFGQPQWAVVGDTFPVGCAFSPKIVLPELFAGNPDTRVPAYSTRLGIYEEGCGLDRVEMSWGHDEYLSLTAGVITLAMGFTQNREYAELIWAIDLGVLLVLALIF